MIWCMKYIWLEFCNSLLLANPRRGLVAAQDIAENESIAQPPSLHNVDLICRDGDRDQSMS